MLKLFAAAGLALAAASASDAATITVTGFSPGYQSNTVAIAPEATITSFGTDLYFGGAYLGEPGSFCAISGFGCAADMEIAFIGVVSNLMFDVGGYQFGDLVNLDVFGIGNALLGSIAITSDVTGLDLSSFGSITRLFFDDSSTGAGVGYANFSFDQVAAPVPLPAAGFLLIGALGGLAALRRRKAA